MGEVIYWKEYDEPIVKEGLLGTGKKTGELVCESDKVSEIEFYGRSCLDPKVPVKLSLKMMVDGIKWDYTSDSGDMEEAKKWLIEKANDYLKQYI